MFYYISPSKLWNYSASAQFLRNYLQFSFVCVLFQPHVKISFLPPTTRTGISLEKNLNIHRIMPGRIKSFRLSRHNISLHNVTWLLHRVTNLQGYYSFLINDCGSYHGYKPSLLCWDLKHFFKYWLNHSFLPSNNLSVSNGLIVKFRGWGNSYHVSLWFLLLCLFVCLF